MKSRLIKENVERFRKKIKNHGYSSWDADTLARQALSLAQSSQSRIASQIVLFAKRHNTTLDGLLDPAHHGVLKYYPTLSSSFSSKGESCDMCGVNCPQGYIMEFRQENCQPFLALLHEQCAHALAQSDGERTALRIGELLRQEKTLQVQRAYPSLFEAIRKQVHIIADSDDAAYAYRRVRSIFAQESIIGSMEYDTFRHMTQCQRQMEDADFRTASITESIVGGIPRERLEKKLERIGLRKGHHIDAPTDIDLIANSENILKEWTILHRLAFSSMDYMQLRSALHDNQVLELMEANGPSHGSFPLEWPYIPLMATSQTLTGADEYRIVPNIARILQERTDHNCTSYERMREFFGVDVLAELYNRMLPALKRERESIEASRRLPSAENVRYFSSFDFDLLSMLEAHARKVPPERILKTIARKMSMATFHREILGNLFSLHFKMEYARTVPQREKEIMHSSYHTGTHLLRMAGLPDAELAIIKRRFDYRDDDDLSLQWARDMADRISSTFITDDRALLFQKQYRNDFLHAGKKDIFPSDLASLRKAAKIYTLIRDAKPIPAEKRAAIQTAAEQRKISYAAQLKYA